MIARGLVLQQSGAEVRRFKENAFTAKFNFLFRFFYMFSNVFQFLRFLSLDDLMF